MLRQDILLFALLSFYVCIFIWFLLLAKLYNNVLLCYYVCCVLPEHTKTIEYVYVLCANKMWWSWRRKSFFFLLLDDYYMVPGWFYRRRCCCRAATHVEPPHCLVGLLNLCGESVARLQRESFLKSSKWYASCYYATYKPIYQNIFILSAIQRPPSTEQIFTKCSICWFRSLKIFV